MSEASGASRSETRLGATIERGGIRFAVRSGTAERIWLCLFDEAGETETARHEMARGEGGVFSCFVPKLKAGQRYGLRADGPYDPGQGFWFDPDKLLVDPYAVELDRPFVHDARLAARRGEGPDTAPLVPKAIAVVPPAVDLQPPLFRSGGLVYELSVRAFTMRHPDVPAGKRGTIGALAEPPVIEHLLKLGVSAVELMPVVAWIDERHLPPLGLANAWGYNPVAMMALDPRLAPGGVAELRDTVAALREAGIGTILDLVLNHSGESDVLGTTLSMRGLDARGYYRHVPEEGWRLVNDTGTGNTLACDHPIVADLVIDTLRHFVATAGVDGFRFDLAPVLGRGPDGFDPAASLLTLITSDSLLAPRLLIAEPWDIGPGGYCLGRFPDRFLEWNDRYRDDVRRFWRGDAGTVGALATRLAGSSDIFGGACARTVNFVAAHDGMTLADVTRYAVKHNEANGEDNRDGHDENFSWNGGVEGGTPDPAIVERRRSEQRALLATLFASRGTIMLTAGDEFGRTQHGNNNAYAQDNPLTWLDWEGRDRDLEAFVARLSALRRATPALGETGLLTGHPVPGRAVPDVEWLTETGAPLGEADWPDPGRRRIAMLLDAGDGGGGRLAVLFNADRRQIVFSLPERLGFRWLAAIPESRIEPDGRAIVPGRGVAIAREAVAQTKESGDVGG